MICCLKLWFLDSLFFLVVPPVSVWIPRTAKLRRSASLALRFSLLVHLFSQNVIGIRTLLFARAWKEHACTRFKSKDLSWLNACGATSGRTDFQVEHGNEMPAPLCPACLAETGKNGSLRSARHIVSAKTPICTGYCAYACLQQVGARWEEHARGVRSRKKPYFIILHFHS